MKLTADVHLVPTSRMQSSQDFMTWCLIKHRGNVTFIRLFRVSAILSCIEKNIYFSYIRKQIVGVGRYRSNVYCFKWLAKLYFSGKNFVGINGSFHVAPVRVIK